MTVSLSDVGLASIDDDAFISASGDDESFQKFAKIDLDNNPLKELNEAAFGPLIHARSTSTQYKEQNVATPTKFE